MRQHPIEHTLCRKLSQGPHNQTAQNLFPLQRLQIGKGLRQVFASTHDSADAVAKSLEGVVTRYLRPDDPAPSATARPTQRPVERAPDEVLTPRGNNARDAGGI